MKRRILIVTLIVSLLLSSVAFSESDTNKEVLYKIFTINYNEMSSLFDQSFLNQVPAEKIIELVEAYKANFGMLNDIEWKDNKYILVFEKGRFSSQIKLNDKNRIVALYFRPPTLEDDSAEKVLSEIKALDGLASVCIMKNNKDVLLSYNEDKPMAVGSAFKLYVLKAVYDEIEAKDASWEDVIALNKENISLPTGFLQEWTVGTPVTLKTLTNLMISVSDNTATDHLIEYIGRENIEKNVSDINKPFLKTTEVFKIKWLLEKDLQQKYINGSESYKEEILNLVKDKDLTLDNILTSPTLVNDVEWFFTTKELCNTIYDLKDTSEITINPGLANKQDWSLVGYKGGSEPGVLQYTHLLQKEENSDIYTVSITVNNTKNDVDANKITDLTIRLISLIKDGKV
ncbi:serine hydrolase [Clostridiisalibacter paucivorans]|uniref:serine hydrolase n=1 Tax=Clostridiisalibacter paucivorans TaxID=408753 RepID=UPI00047C178D|nr:serine hydrolase [Clostridiisalibacter paucivorans]